MDFTRYVCWDPDRAFRVLAAVDERMDDDLFAAVHKDYPVYRLDTMPASSGGGESRSPLAIEDFKAQFERHNLKVIVVGESGSGKSHLVRWLYLNLARHDDWHVRFIPKTGTNLRGIIQLLLDVLPAPSRKRYEERLSTSAYESEAPEHRKGLLLSMLARSIEADFPQESEPDARELEAELIKRLPPLFDDPNHRQELSAKGGIVESLANHISDVPSEYNRIESRRQFIEADLCLTGPNINKLSEISSHAVWFLKAGGNTYVESALRIINRNLERAILRVLNFTSEDLQQLMRDIRRFLKGEDKSLVLLFEDFARAEGIDRRLLEALIEPEGPELCELRWVAACTTGYYDSLADTVQTRLDFRIDMDEAVLLDEALINFTARYLRAVRSAPDALHLWYEEGRFGNVEVPNSCSSCLYQPECHSTFGESENIGLYPFNRQALMNMANRRVPELVEHFNPRAFLKAVIRDVLESGGPTIPDSLFPDEPLLVRMGGSTLSPLTQDQFKLSSPEHYKRQLAILELWGVPGRITQVSEGIFHAFDIPLPSLRGEVSPPILPPIPQPATDAHSQRVQAVRDWGLGGMISEPVASVVRPVLYPALISFIDWDAVGLERTAFASPTGTAAFFRRQDFIFRNQQNPNSQGNVVLQIAPGQAEDKLREAAVAVEAILNLQQHESWNFENGFEQALYAADALDAWSDDVLAQIRDMPHKAGRWEPVRAAVELLLVAAALVGRAPTGATAAELVDALFSDLPEECRAQSSQMKNLYRSIWQMREPLTATVRAWASGVKGGQAGTFLDASQIVPVIERLGRTWKLQAKLPKTLDSPTSYGRLCQLHQKVSETLPVAAQDELEARRSWLTETRTHIDEGETVARLIEAVDASRDAAKKSGLAFQLHLDQEYESAKNALAVSAADSAVSSVGSVIRTKNALSILPELAASETLIMDTLSRYLKAAARLVSDIRAAEQKERDRLNNQADLDTAVAQISESLTTLTKAFEELT